MPNRAAILLVEDNDSEEMLALRAIKKADVNCEVFVARDGEEACRVLFEGEGPVPELVLLDLHLPKVDGFEILERMRRDDATRRVPVVILSSSGEPQDVTRCFELHANSYVQKESDYHMYNSRMKLLLYYWLALNEKAG